jgi:hypothetical protein
MRIGIMQPYYYPYLGYFQLISAVDVWVNMDHVAFMKRSYMTRNSLKEGAAITLPVKKGSQNQNSRSIEVDLSSNLIRKFFSSIQHLYGKSENYDELLDLITPAYTTHNKSVAELNFDLISRICAYLDMETTLVPSSIGMTEYQKSKGIIEIVQSLNGTEYINAIGGVDLYDKTEFDEYSIDLKFLKMNITGPDHNLSILHHLFTTPKEVVKELLGDYSLV